MNAESSMNQAPDTINFYLNKAIKSIDEKFGDGFAKAHPELVGVYIQGCVSDYKTSRMEFIGKAVAESLFSISNAIETSNLLDK